MPEGYLGADFRLLLTPHRPNYIYYPEMTDVIMPFDIPMSMAVSERIAEILRRFGAEEQAVQLIPVPVYEETTGLYLGRFYLVHCLLRVSGVIVLGEGLETVRIEVAGSAVPDAPLFRVQDVEARTKPEEVVREDVRAALEGAGITGVVGLCRLCVCGKAFVCMPHTTHGLQGTRLVANAYPQRFANRSKIRA